MDYRNADFATRCGTPKEQKMSIKARCYAIFLKEEHIEKACAYLDAEGQEALKKVQVETNRFVIFTARHDLVAVIYLDATGYRLVNVDVRLGSLDVHDASTILSDLLRRSSEWRRIGQIVKNIYDPSRI